MTKVNNILHFLAIFIGLRSAVTYGRLGKVLLSEKTSRRTLRSAKHELRMAAEQEDPQAQFMLGWMSEYGEGVPKDDVETVMSNLEAVKWYRKAADQGHAKAQFHLGWMYDNGKGVAKDIVEAGKLYLKAADQGDAEAMRKLWPNLP
jgi:TPR repeat protein